MHDLTELTEKQHTPSVGYWSKEKLKIIIIISKVIDCISSVNDWVNTPEVVYFFQKRGLCDKG